MSCWGLPFVNLALHLSDTVCGSVGIMSLIQMGAKARELLGILYQGLDAVTNDFAVLSSASFPQRWCVTLARGTVTKSRSRSTLAMGILVDSRLLSTQVAGPITLISCPGAQRPLPAENMNEGNGHKGTKVPFQRPDRVSPPSRLPAEGACYGIQQPESCLGGRTVMGT